MVSLVLYSSGSGGVTALVSGNNAAERCLSYYAKTLEVVRKGPTYYDSHEYYIVRKYTRSHKLL